MKSRTFYCTCWLLSFGKLYQLALGAENFVYLWYRSCQYVVQKLLTGINGSPPKIQTKGICPKSGSVLN